MKALEWSEHFPHYNPMGGIRCHGHQSFDPAQNLMQPFPHPNDGSVKILLRLANWLQRYSSLKMSTDPQTDTQTDDGSTGIHKLKIVRMSCSCHSDLSLNHVLFYRSLRDMR